MLFVIGRAKAQKGDRRGAEDVIRQLQEISKTQYVRTYWVACIYAALGDKTRTLEALEKSFEDKDIFLPRIKSDPMMDLVREEPQFKSLLQRMNIPVK